LAQRAHWQSKAGFILAAAGSAVGLGNIWGFPKVTADNGGGVFVLVYLACVLLVGLPVMTAEILLGRSTQKAPVGAIRTLAGKGSPWIVFGWLGVASGFMILSFYSVVAGWSLHYVWLAITGGIDAANPQVTGQLYNDLFAGSPWLNVFWHLFFMCMVVGVVIGGIAKGVERWSTILMPVLFVMLIGLLIRAFTLDGWGQAVDFVFGLHFDKFTPRGALEALGQAFFSLSLGMGAILTYGSYLKKDDDILSSAITISALDTAIAIAAAMVLFPIIFTNNMEAAAGPGLVFITIPVALYKLPAGGFLAMVFFGLLVVAALTSAISMLEVATSSAIDELGWSRKKATVIAAAGIAALGVPSALSGSSPFFGTYMAETFGQNWFDTIAYITNNFMLPMGGLGIAIYTGWRMDDAIRHKDFLSGTKLGAFYKGWILLLKFLVPVAIIFVFLNAIGLLRG
jgi:neurotransmitter:Na+ symporter, NSS family